jgi:hypothetical protein
LKSSQKKLPVEGEIISDLDSPRLEAFDNLAKNIFANHIMATLTPEFLKP